MRAQQKFRQAFVLLVLAIVLFALFDNAVAADRDSVDLESAVWKEDRSYVKIKASGRLRGEKGRRYLYIRNADTDAILKRRRVRLNDEGKWELEYRLYLSEEIPCRLQLTMENVSDAADIRKAPDNCAGGVQNLVPVANAGSDQSLTLAPGQSTVTVTLNASASFDADGSIVLWNWSGTPNPADMAMPSLELGAGEYEFQLLVVDNDSASSATDSVMVSVSSAVQVGEVSINSTSDSTDTSQTPVPEAELINNGDYALLAANDLGMHCADLDYRIFSILPPFNVMHAQLIRKGVGGEEPEIIDNQDMEVLYSAASNPNDPVLAEPGLSPVYKGNFWHDEDGDGRTVGFDAYSPLFFGLLQPGDIAQQDVGLPVPDSILLRDCLQGYLDGVEGADGPRANCGLGQQVMPGIDDTFVDNEPVPFDRFDHDVNFFNELLGGVGLGGIIEDVNWFAADGVPMLPVDDSGRSNAYPVMRVQARQISTGEIVASTDMVVPVASEADCQGCHALPLDCETTTQATDIPFVCNGVATDRTSFNLMTLDGDDDGTQAPGATPLERLLNVAKINILRVHDAKHGTSLDAQRSVQCATCHYSPALDLAQLGPVDSAATEQRSHISMSRAMHGHHGELLDDNGALLFPDMASPEGRNPDLAQVTLEETCYQCHPGKRTQCLRGAMAAGGVVCQDCHGEMRHVGNDFSESLATHPWPDGANLNKRVPWAAEPSCGACHTGDAMNNLAGQVDVPVAPDGIRLLQAYTIKAGLDGNGNEDGTELIDVIQPNNQKFAENETLYRLSKGHGGVMCEGCHGSTHAIYPNPNPWANDNLTTTQLQGHSGTLIECDTCHARGSLPLTLDGPHGMHPVNDNNWRNDHKEFDGYRANACRSCHGRNGEGTVLSVVAADRTFRCEKGDGSLCDDSGKTVTLRKGTRVSCTLCHENQL